MYGAMLAGPPGPPPFLAVERIANGYVATFRVAIMIEPPHVATPQVGSPEIQEMLGAAAGILRSAGRAEQQWEIVTHQVFCPNAAAVLETLGAAEQAWTQLQEATRGMRIQCGG